MLKHSTLLSRPILCLLAAASFAVSQNSSALALPGACAADLQGGVQLQRSKGLALCDGHPLPSTGSASKGQPLALASADFDEDGVPDLVTAFGSGASGMVTIYRGNIAALWPYGAAIVSGPPSPFLPNPRSFTVNESPDLVVAGDFDLDGHVDIVTARRGGSALCFLKGDGHGGFAAAKRIKVDGNITDLIAGDFNQPDGVADLIVGVSGSTGDAALVYDSMAGGLKSQPKSYALTHPATALALGRFSGTGLVDLAVGGGNGITVIHGRHLHSDPATEAAPVTITHQTVPFAVRALTSGDFIGTVPSIAALSDDGKVHLLAHSVSADVVGKMSTAAVAGMSAVGAGKVSTPVGLSAETSTVSTQRISAMQQSAAGRAEGGEWTERSAIAMPSGFSQRMPRLVAARVSGAKQEDLLVIDSSNSQVHVLSTGRAAVTTDTAKAALAGTAPRSMVLQASLDAASEPVAVLPMRLSQHGLNGLVSLVMGQSTPIIAPQDVPASQSFVVTNTSDITDPSQKNTPPAGSLRAAMLAAQQQTSTNIAGGSTAIASVTFNIPTTDPGYNATTGIFTIKPISEAANTGGPFQDTNALPTIYAAITIDGYTQPGASPNTLANGDNARILIQIDGGNATVPGGSGIRPFDDTGSVIRGLALTGWTNPALSANSSGGSTASGAWGIEASGLGDFFEGNFIGTADGKTAAGNRIGVFVDNGPGLGSTAGGNIVGGTTPQARNVVSGNTLSGIILYYTGTEAQVQGNFIGLDVTGAAVLPNTVSGITGVEPTNTVGGTQAGARNYVAGNSNNIDINDITESNQETGGLVVGNYVGTDVTGTKGLSPNSGGVSIQIGPTNYIIGGTSPAARNLLSGNYQGVSVAQNAFYNTILGNYIGTDPTGTIAVPNVLDGIGVGFTVAYSGISPVAAGYTTIGGTAAGAGNLIAGNSGDGISIIGTSSPDPGYSAYIGNTVQGNLIGTDVTGTKSLPNTGNGISMTSGVTNNTVGGTTSGAANVIANNGKNGVLVDPVSGATSGPGSSNVTISNVIRANAGAGVRIVSGTANRISANSIFGNGALGIDIDAAGPGTNSHCNTTNSGANMLQNYPVLTAGTGSSSISATATDPSGNTSEFSKTVQATAAGNLLSLVGTFDSKPSTKFLIEFFSNTAADASGYGQGQTYLGSTSVTTDANCGSTIADPIDTTTADVSVALSLNTTAGLMVGPDFGTVAYIAAVANNGPATAHNVTFTDTLPSQLQVSSTYCNLASCQSPITTSQGVCTVSGKTITCTLGTMATGSTATISIPVQTLATGSVMNTGNVKATETDPNLLNNTATLTTNATDPYPAIDHLDTVSALVNSASFPLNIFGTGLLSSTTVSFNGTNLPVTGVADNQSCPSSYGPQYCTALHVQVPASLLTNAGTYAVEVKDPEGATNDSNFVVASACTYNVQSFLTGLSSSETDLIAESVYVATNVAGCSWTASSSLPWVTILDNSPSTGTGTVDIAIAANTTTTARSGTITIAGQSVAVSQAAGSASNCTETLSANSASVAAGGGTGMFTVTASASGCSQFVEPYPQNSTNVPNVQWITTGSNNLVASNTVTYAVAPNNGLTRTGSIAIGGSVFTITQAAPACVFTLSPASTIAPAGGGTGTFTVVPAPASCAWTATPSNTAQVTITSGASGTGNGTVNYTVANNTAGPQTPTISIGNSIAASLFTINQASATTCTFTLSPGSASTTSEGGSNFFVITASFPFCKWTATSNNPDAVSIVQGFSGTGTGSVLFDLGQNAGSARVLTITAGCQTFTINQAAVAATASNPVPVLTSLQSTTAVAGSAAFTLTVNGSSFVSGAVVNFNGVARITTFVSATQLTASILVTDIANAGPLPVTVTNPSLGGGASNALTFTVTVPTTNPVPVLSQLSPSSVVAGSGAFNLTVTGTGFVSGATVNVNGSARATTFVSATQLTAAITAADVATQGSLQITTTNPTPGCGASNALTLTITAPNNPVPVLTQLSPSSVVAGSGAFNLTVRGTSFVSGATVNVNGSARTTIFVSATQLTAAIPATDIATQGSLQITATNPAPGGGVSNTQILIITAANNPVPVLSQLSPSSVVAGSGAFNLTVTGTGFVNGATVNVYGSARTTTFVSATQLTAAIIATDVATQGSLQITATNPTPGGGASNALTLTVTAPNNPVPVLSQLSTSSVAAGSAAFTLTVTGTGFVSGATVNVNGSARTTTFVSATQLTAAITALDEASPAALQITVANPTPGGGTSNALTLTVVAPSNPVPAITNLSPATVAAGSADFALTITGSNFLGGSVVNINGSARTTTYVSATSLTVKVLAADVLNPSSLSVTVTNPTPGGGTSSSVILTVAVTAAASFTLSSPGGAQTVAAGSTAIFSIVATPQSGTYATPIVLSVSGLPAGATASFSPASLTPGNSSATSILTITAPVLRASSKDGPANWIIYALLVPLCGGLLHRRRAYRGLTVLLLLLAVSMASLTGCGGGFLYPTTAQAYTLTVTGTAGATQQTTTIQLTVNF